MRTDPEDLTVDVMCSMTASLLQKIRDKGLDPPIESLMHSAAQALPESAGEQFCTEFMRGLALWLVEKVTTTTEGVAQ